MLAASAAVRKTRPVEKTPEVMAMSDLPNPAFAMLNAMARVTAAYAELPYRLAQCRSPMDLSREQAQFAQRLFSDFFMTGPAAPGTMSPRGK